VAGPKLQKHIGPIEKQPRLRSMEMTKLWGFLARVRKDESGATMIEYSILIGIITAAAIGAIVLMGGYVTSQWAKLTSAVGLS
jgi:pilus assembly protein Flp/PilA